MTAEEGKRVLVIGLDCAAPEFVFGPGRFALPNIQSLMEAGCWGRLESCHPPITVPAWSCMMTGKDPGTLGCYGFRNRRDRSYDPLRVSTSADVKEARVWDILSAAGKEVVVLGVPQTYPPTPVKGCLVSGILTPDSSVEYTYPTTLKGELEAHCEEYLFDVADYRTDDKAALIDRCYALMHNRFDVADYLMANKPWDFFMMVEMGVDRVHHGFWSCCDPSHPRFEAGNEYEHVIREYYEAVDDRIGDILSRVGDETAVMVVSDHGAKALQGGFCINQWLIDEGLLRLLEEPEVATRLEDCKVDWPNTKVWSTGGYYARLFINLEGREPEGVVRVKDYAALRDEIAQKIESVSRPDGSPMHNRVFKPEELYQSVRGVAPDLIVYLDDLHRRAVGTVGMDSVHTSTNDTGPDEANHAQHGIFIMDDKIGGAGEELQETSILSVAPTVLRLLNQEPPDDMQAESLV